MYPDGDPDASQTLIASKLDSDPLDFFRKIQLVVYHVNKQADKRANDNKNNTSLAEVIKLFMCQSAIVFCCCVSELGELKNFVFLF